MINYPGVKKGQIQHVEHPADLFDKTVFGFWIYIMTDCILFATFFATYAVLHSATAGGPSAKDLFNLPHALAETLLLLTSSFTCGLAMLAAHKQQKLQTLLYFGATFILGAAFLFLELKEFHELVAEGNTWQKSAFLSSFFALVGCHGLHITSGLIWILVMVPLVVVRGLTDSTLRRLTCLSLFWHFLDVIWVLIFTFVYLMGAS